MTGKRHDGMVCGLPIRQPGDERVAEVMQPALNPSQLAASSPSHFPTSDGLLRVAVPYGHGSMLVAFFTVWLLVEAKTRSWPLWPLAGQRSCSLLPVSESIQLDRKSTRQN